jgi:hypothetical protein
MVNSKVISTIDSDATTHRLALLIDADNAQPSVIDALLAEVARFGEATIKRIYGDFTKSTSTQWKQVLNRLAINPIQQFAYTTGKNATDSKLIIEAMDLLHKGNVDGFCLVSSDSDFTGLASRIREEGLLVYGFGEHKTPESFRNACHQFVFTENLRSITEIAPKREKISTRIKSTATETDDSKRDKRPPQLPIALLKEAVENTNDDTGWTHLGTLGSYLNKVKPDFDSRTFGHKKLKDLFLSLTEYFEFEERKSNNSQNKNFYVRMKSNNHADQ